MLQRRVLFRGIRRHGYTFLIIFELHYRFPQALMVTIAD